MLRAVTAKRLRLGKSQTSGVFQIPRPRHQNLALEGITGAEA